MSKKPVLILQMQRMGDLVLCFPLLLWAARTYPGRPIRVVAEEAFSTPLLPLSPPAEYVSWAQAGTLAGGKYHLVVNLSIRPEAAQLAGSLEAEHHVGPVLRGGILRLHGPWQLYRASVVGNNRHNRFHWADLNALDFVPREALRVTQFDSPRLPAEANRRAVGVFAGASEAAKRPDAPYYASLLRELLDRGLNPVLLGGPADAPLAAQIRTLFDGKVLDLVGKLSVAELAAIGQTLGLLITPDTGPMHLAAWTGLRTLNLSVGPVSPWETGPHAPGHLVARSTASCAQGCWRCTRAAFLCQRGLTPRRVAALAALALGQDDAAGMEERLARQSMPGLCLYATDRSPEGLYRLRPLSSQSPRVSSLAAEFWQAFFLWRISGVDPATASAAWAALLAAQPKLAEGLCAHLPRLGRALSDQAVRGLIVPESAYRETPPFWRPFAGYVQMLAHNEDASPQVARRCLEHFEALAALCL